MAEFIDGFHTRANRSFKAYLDDPSFAPRTVDFYPLLGPVSYYVRTAFGNPTSVKNAVKGTAGIACLAIYNYGLFSVLHEAAQRILQ